MGTPCMEYGQHCADNGHAVFDEVLEARRKAHEKHGDNSIEAEGVDDSRMLAIFVEEVGELAHELTYDTTNGSGAKRAEIIDCLAVLSAWVDKIDGNQRFR
jgi:NTP pyrophosphatase (non-canonical NTP hydrolase)